MLSWPPKDSGDKADFGINWSAALMDGETITSSTWTIEPNDITVGDGTNGMPAPSHTSTITTVWLGGGQAGRSYHVHNNITTSQGRTYCRHVNLEVREH